MAIYTATGEASCVYSISVFTYHMKVSIHTASLEIVHAHRVRPVPGLMAPKKQYLVVYCLLPGRPLGDFDGGVQ